MTTGFLMTRLIWIMVTLTSDLVFRIIMCGAYHCDQIWCIDASCDEEVSRIIRGSLSP